VLIYLSLNSNRIAENAGMFTDFHSDVAPHTKNNVRLAPFTRKPH
jgi:hypothetical protein